MEYLVAVILGLVVGAFATTTGFDRDRAFYPTVLIVVASYYALFAVMGADSGGWRSGFRTDVDHCSEVMPISVPN
jgi:hypothetical protein